jgi:predicted TIM-barrel fold metal-dependent hydrolase
LDLRGVCVLASDPTRPLVSTDADPLLARISQLQVPIFLHPSFRSLLAGIGFPVPIDMAVGWLNDTSAVALDLVLAGVFDRHPGLSVVHPHLGGVVPFLAGRITAIAGQFGLERPVPEILRAHFYVDSASNTAGAVALAAATYGWDRILLGTDFPWVPRIASLSFLTQEGVPVEKTPMPCHAMPGLAMPTTA